MIRDIQFGLKMLWKDRGYALTAILTLGVCIGANTATFTIVHSVLLKPLPVPDSDRILGEHSACFLNFRSHTYDEP